MGILLKGDLCSWASSSPRLSLSRNTHTHTHMSHVTVVKLCRPCTLSLPCLIFIYLFLFSHSFSSSPTFLCFISHLSTSLLTKSQTHLGRGPTFAKQQRHKALSRCALGLPWPRVCCTTWRSQRATQAAESACWLVHLSGLKAEALSHRDVWWRMLSHSSAHEVFIRLLFLN